MIFKHFLQLGIVFHFIHSIVEVPLFRLHPLDRSAASVGGLRARFISLQSCSLLKHLQSEFFITIHFT